MATALGDQGRAIGKAAHSQIHRLIWWVAAIVGTRRLLCELGGDGDVDAATFRAHLVAPRVVHDDIPDLLADFGAARLTGGDDFAARLLQAAGEGSKKNTKAYVELAEGAAKDLAAGNLTWGAWNKLAPENRAAIEKLAKEMEPEFWKVSESEHAQRMAQLRQNGMTVEPASKELLDRMRAVTRPMWDEFGKAAGPEGAKILADYRTKTGK